MAIKLSAGSAILPEDSPERESMSEFTHMVVGMIQSLPGYWIECLTSWWFVDSSLPHGFLHRAAHNVALASNTVSKQESKAGLKDKSHCLFIG